MINPRIILALGPHPDDVELGCGGFLARFRSAAIHIRAFSHCEASLPRGASSSDIAMEAGHSASLVGADAEVLDFHVRRFDRSRQEILEAMIKMSVELSPDLVLVPASSDIHQDHEVIRAEAQRAFRSATILGYEIPWSTGRPFSPQLLVPLAPAHTLTKVEMLGCFESQKDRAYVRPENVLALLRVRGVQARCQYAEAFEVVRMVADGLTDRDQSNGSQTTDRDEQPISQKSQTTEPGQSSREALRGRRPREDPQCKMCGDVRLNNVGDPCEACDGGMAFCDEPDEICACVRERSTASGGHELAAHPNCAACKGEGVVLSMSTVEQ